MRVYEFVSNQNLNFQGIGQEDVVKSSLDKLKAAIEAKAIWLVVAGAIIGMAGTTLLAESSFGPVTTVAGGLVMAAGLLPTLFGAIG